MNRIHEISVSGLGDMVQFVNEHWKDLSRRPRVGPEQKELSYWKELQGCRRILVYRIENKILGMITLSKEGDVTSLDNFFIADGMRRQGIGTTLLNMSERLAGIWRTKYMVMVADDQEGILPFFQQLGFILQCPLASKGHVYLEKRLTLTY